MMAPASHRRRAQKKSLGVSGICAIPLPRQEVQMRTSGSKIPSVQQPGKSRDSSSGASRLRLACHTEVIVTGKSSCSVAVFTASYVIVTDFPGMVLSENFQWLTNQVSSVKVAFFTSFTYVILSDVVRCKALAGKFLEDPHEERVSSSTNVLSETTCFDQLGQIYSQPFFLADA